MMIDFHSHDVQWLVIRGDGAVLHLRPQQPEGTNECWGLFPVDVAGYCGSSSRQLTLEKRNLSTPFLIGLAQTLAKGPGLEAPLRSFAGVPLAHVQPNWALMGMRPHHGMLPEKGQVTQTLFEYALHPEVAGAPLAQRLAWLVALTKIVEDHHAKGRAIGNLNPATLFWHPGQRPAMVPLGRLVGWSPSREIVMGWRKPNVREDLIRLGGLIHALAWDAGRIRRIGLACIRGRMNAAEARDRLNAFLTWPNFLDRQEGHTPMGI